MKFSPTITLALALAAGVAGAATAQTAQTPSTDPTQPQATATQAQTPATQAQPPAAQAQPFPSANPIGLSCPAPGEPTRHFMPVDLPIVIDAPVPCLVPGIRTLRRLVPTHRQFNPQHAVTPSVLARSTSSRLEIPT